MRIRGVANILLRILPVLTGLLGGCVRAKPPQVQSRVLPTRTLSATPILSASPILSATMATETREANEVLGTVAVPVVAQSGEEREAYPQPTLESPTSTPTTISPQPTIVPTSTFLPSPTATWPAPSPSPTPPPATDIPYVVRYGDTLLSIASRFGSTVADIMSKNGIINPHMIYAGQELLIPVGYTPSATPIVGPVQHTVAAGETLSQLARLYRTTTTAILQENPQVTDSQHPAVGAVLTITIGTEPLVFTHRVRPGESLSRIAQMYGVSIGDLVQLNGLTDPNRVRVGQVLMIPTG